MSGDGGGGWGSENRKRSEHEGSGEAARGNFSSLRGARVMERDVSGMRERAFFQSICPASRPRVNGTGPIKKARRLGQTESKNTDERMHCGVAEDTELQ